MAKIQNTVTYFPHLLNPDTPEHFSVHHVLEWVRGGRFQQQVEAIRAEPDPGERKRLKEALPLVCFSGKFSKRANAGLLEHSGLLCLDLDKIPEGERDAERAKLQALPCTYAVFCSPSGNGLKVLARIPADKDRHREHFRAMLEHIGSPYMDKSTGDPARACFVSWDPDLYVNDGAEAFTLPPPTAPPAPDQQGVPPFPIHVFPEPLAGYARELQRSLNFPIDYTGAAFLFAASVAIGNSVHVKVKEGWTMAAILWVALVGRPGTSKTHPLDTALKHLKDRDTESYTRYKAELVQWEQEERDRTKRQEGHEAPKVRPVWRPHLVGDITMEALVGKLECSPRGLGVHRDELAGWWGSMDQYRKGSDRENWLTLHNGSTVDALRRTAGEVRVPLPFVSVCGTVQPAKLHTLGKGQDGFQPRILFAYPEKQTKPYFSDASIGSEWPLSYTTVLDRLLALPLNVENNRPAPRMLEFSETARVAFSAWVNLNTDRANAAPSDGIRDIYPKLETYAARIALVLELLDHAATGSAVSEVISGKAMKGAIDLVEYFATTALKVHFHLNEEDAVDRLPDLRKRVYEALPDQFRTGEGQEIADKFGMPQRTFKRFIGNENLFRKEAHGVVTKLR